MEGGGAAEEGPALWVGVASLEAERERPKDQQVKNFLTALQSCQTWAGRGRL